MIWFPAPATLLPSLKLSGDQALGYGFYRPLLAKVLALASAIRYN
ncbi:hypothetical protein Q31b_14700 [Novipirellula aureliae]|uniref:Uncharacterized protein n=1 Tax=Novipirellula aureliae TaxID=2527966 RepID=A0A5C6E4U7_9BACT|nr:hypothetical protein Q31b_14700 [Novipirellula aureliae]